MRLSLLIILVMLASFVSGAVDIVVSDEEDSGGVINIRELVEQIKTFLNLGDTPSTYSSHGGKCVAVNAGETALVFQNCTNATGYVDATYLRLDTTNDPLTDDLVLYKLLGNRANLNFSIGGEVPGKGELVYNSALDMITIMNADFLTWQDAYVTGNLLMGGNLTVYNITAKDIFADDITADSLYLTDHSNQIKMDTSGTGSPVVTLTTELTIGNPTISLPGATTTLGGLNLVQSWTQAQSYTKTPVSIQIAEKICHYGECADNYKQFTTGTQDHNVDTFNIGSSGNGSDVYIYSDETEYALFDKDLSNDRFFSIYSCGDTALYIYANASTGLGIQRALWLVGESTGLNKFSYGLQSQGISNNNRNARAAVFTGSTNPSSTAGVETIVIEGSNRYNTERVKGIIFESFYNFYDASPLTFMEMDLSEGVVLNVSTTEDVIGLHMANAFTNLGSGKSWSLKVDSTDEVYFEPKVHINDDLNVTGTIINPAIYCEASDLVDQPFAVAGARYRINITTTDEGNGITMNTGNNGTNITIDTSGVYHMVLQPQVKAGAVGGGKGDFHMWLEKDTGAGFSDVPHSNIELSLGTNEEDVIVLATTLKLDVGDVVRAVASVSDNKILLHAQSPAGEPVIPSIIFTMYRIGS